MEQFIDRQVKLSFDQSTERTDVVITTIKVVYATGGTPLYILDSDGIVYNWQHIASVTPA